MTDAINIDVKKLFSLNGIYLPKRYPYLGNDYRPMPDKCRDVRHLENTIGAWDVLYMYDFYKTLYHEGQLTKTPALSNSKVTSAKLNFNIYDVRNGELHTDHEEPAKNLAYLESRIADPTADKNTIMMRLIMDALASRDDWLFGILRRAARNLTLACGRQQLVTLPTSGMGNSDAITIYYFDVPEVENRGGYDTNPHLYVFQPGVSNPDAHASDCGAVCSKLSAIYADATWPVYELKDTGVSDVKTCTIRIKDANRPLVLALFYRISDGAHTIAKFARGFPFFQEVSQNVVILGDNDVEIDMFTGAANSSLGVSADGKLQRGYTTRVDATILLSGRPSIAEQELKSCKSRIATRRANKERVGDRDHQLDSATQSASLEFVYHLNDTLVGIQQHPQSLVFQTACGIFDTCAFPLATYAALPVIDTTFYEHSMARAKNVTGLSDVRACELISVFATSAATDIPYLNDNLYGKENDDMRNLLGTHSGDCDDSAIFIYQMILAFITHTLPNSASVDVRNMQAHLRVNYLPGICVMSVVTSSGNVILHQVCALFPRELYKQMHKSGGKNVSAFANVSAGLYPILLEGTVKSFASCEFETNQTDAMCKYASAVAAVVGVKNGKSKLAAYQVNELQALPDNPHAHYISFMSFSSGDKDDKSNFRYLRFSSDGSMQASGVPYRDVLMRKNFSLLDIDMPRTVIDRYDAEMRKAAEYILPVPEIRFDTPVLRFYEQAGIDKARTVLLAFIDDLLSKQLGIQRESSAHDADGLFTRVVFTIKSAHFADFKGVTAELARIKEIKNIASYYVTQWSCFKTDPVIELTLSLRRRRAA